jgi:HNH endonuclease
MGRHRQEVAPRFWEKVDRTGSCWTWTASRTWNGRGRFSMGIGVSVGAHRMAWQLTRGPIPAGMWVLHRCHNGHSGCVTPGHLYLGTPAINSRDAVLAGRIPRGEKTHNAKLSEKKVLLLLRLAGKGVSLVELAQMFSVSRGTICGVLSGRVWKHISNGQVMPQLEFRKREATEIRALRASGWKLDSLASRFRMSKGHVSAICSGKKRR